jgi:hypothetical protein
MSSLPSCIGVDSKSFKDLHSKARRYLWESVFSKIKTDPQELLLLRNITEISPEDPNFEQLIKAQLMNEKIVKLVQKIGALNEKPPRPLKEKETVVLNAPSPAVAAASAPILPSRPPISDEAKNFLFNMHRARHHSQVVDAPLDHSKIVPFEERHSPPRVRRANTEIIFFDGLKEYPPFIQTPKAAAELVQNAVCIQFLFPETYKRLFDKTDRIVFERLVDFHFLTKYRGLNFQESVKKSFSDLNELSNGKKLRSVFSKLMKRQTIGRIQGAQKIPQHMELPKLFEEYPFDTPESIEECLQIIASIKFLCVATFSTYKEDVKRALNLLLQASILRDILHYPYKAALKIVLSQNNQIKDESFKNLLILIRYDEKIMADSSKESQDAEVELQKILDWPQLSHEKTFAAFMGYAEGALDKTFNSRASNLLQLLLKTAFRLQREPILFKDAMQSSFTLNTLRALFGKDDRGNLGDFKQGIQTLSPKIFFPHRSIESDELFANLRDAAKKHPRPASKELEKILKLFDDIENASIRDPSLRRADLVFLHFNQMVLRELFDPKNDTENAKLLSRCMDEILKKSAS